MKENEKVQERMKGKWKWKEKNRERWLEKRMNVEKRESLEVKETILR